MVYPQRPQSIDVMFVEGETCRRVVVVIERVRVIVAMDACVQRKWSTAVMIGVALLPCCDGGSRGQGLLLVVVALPLPVKVMVVRSVSPLGENYYCGVDVKLI
eukprot:TRINITY_DN17120_c0_g1_i2.p2 TRINITY_DN17120_c0_g1~~TRINITY_DN17120_c0_g1_i2.p2  ORF type:complete len:103 (+),score=0.49 TRINITY_DN17120_c0_g1_i2:118-426(+)